LITITTKNTLHRSSRRSNTRAPAINAIPYRRRRWKPQELRLNLHASWFPTHAGLLPALGRLCGLGWRGLLGEEKHNPRTTFSMSIHWEKC
jgi:hypothetical protein